MRQSERDVLFTTEGPYQPNKPCEFSDRRFLSGVGGVGRCLAEWRLGSSTLSPSVLRSGRSCVGVSAALGSHAVVHHVIPDGGNADTEGALVSAAAVHSGKDSQPRGGQKVDSLLLLS